MHDLGTRRCGIVSFTLDGRPAGELRQALAAERINVSVSSRDSTRIDMERRGLGELLRASVHYYNTEDELARFTQAVAAL